MGLEPRDTGRTGSTYDHSQSFTGEFCRVLSLRLWALQDEKPLFPKGACSHQGTRQGAHGTGLQLPAEYFGISASRDRKQEESPSCQK